MERRLAAIVAADIVGFSRMMGENQADTVNSVRKFRSETLNPILAEYGGTVLKSMGDGWLLEFSSVSGAVNAAMQIQDRLAKHPSVTLRIGVNMGDITITEDDFYGDGVNIASRLEGLAPTGGILISEAVYASLDGTLTPSFENAGAQQLKNISRAVKTWVRQTESSSRRPVSRSPQRRDAAFPVLTVIPSRTNQADQTIEDLAHSLTADFATFFGGIAWLSCEIAETPPGSSYVLQSSLRAQGDRMRLETRLFDPLGSMIWTDKSDGSLDESFEWQDRVVEHIGGVSTDLILEAETMVLAAIPEEKLLPEQCMLMGMMAWKTFSNEAFEAATRYHARAIAEKPDLADAYAEAIIVVCAARTMGPSSPMQEYMKTMPQWVEAARPIAPGHAMLTLAIGIADYLSDRRMAPLNQAVTQVLRQAPFDARVLSFCGWAYLWAGDAQTALAFFEKSIRLGRTGPFLVAAQGGAATAAVQLNLPKKALEHCDAGFRLSDEYPTLYSTKSAALVLLGEIDAAKKLMVEYLKLQPGRTLRYWRATNDYGKSEGGERYFEALRLAGLPEG